MIDKSRLPSMIHDLSKTAKRGGKKYSYEKEGSEKV